MSQNPILIAGHYCHDTLLLSNGTRSNTLGGSASYISSILSALEVNCDVSSKVGQDFAYASLVQCPPQVISTKLTTQFIADFTHGERIQKVGAICESIYPKDIPTGKNYEISMAVGIIGELPPESILKLKTISRYLLCDLQGLIRVTDAAGNVLHEPLKKTAYYPYLDQISFLKASRHEASSLDIEEVRQKTCLLVTEGKEGCTVYLKDREYRVPAFQTEELDPTGAGDCFFAGFAAGLLRGMNIENSVKMGNYFGALAVGQIGVPRVDKAFASDFINHVKLS